MNSTFTQADINSGYIAYTHDGSETTADSFTFTVSDGGGGSIGATAFSIAVTPVDDAPAISTGSTTSITEGGTEAFTASATDPEGNGITWSITGGDDAAKFSIDSNTGAVTFIAAPSHSAPSDDDADNDYVLEITASDGAVSSSKTVTVTVTQQGTSGSGSYSGTSTDSADEADGQKQNAGTSSTQTIGGQIVTTITVDDSKMENILENSGEKPTVTFTSGVPSDAVICELNGRTVKNMEQKDAVLEIRTDTVTYTLSASQISIDSISGQLGSQVAFEDIKISVKIAEPSADTVQIVEDTANKNGYQIVVSPVEFEITCTSGDRTVTVSKFDSYVERVIAIPDGVDPSMITTGAVLNTDGTLRQVPTEIISKNGKYFAKISSLSNSTYSVIRNPVEFKDVENCWARAAINDMGSRMILKGDEEGNYNPNNVITRAEFAAILVRAMGLAQGTAESSFDDVSMGDWFNGYVVTVSDYGMIAGYDESSYGPDDAITREQAMVMIARAMKMTGLSISLTDSEADALLLKYSDGTDVSDYAKKSVAACLRTGIVNGTGTSAISPKEYVTRAEVAVMVRHLLQKSGLIWKNKTETEQQNHYPQMFNL